MTKQERTHEIFSEPAEVRMAFVEKLIESVMDEEVDAEVEDRWGAQFRGALSEQFRRIGEDGGLIDLGDEIERQIVEREVESRQFHINRHLRMTIAEELIDSLDEAEDVQRQALRKMCGEARRRHHERTRFTLG